MATSMTLIGSVNVGVGGQATITFTSISNTYTDLKIIASIRMANTSGDIGVYFNTAATDSSDKNVFSNGTSAASDNHSAQQSIYIAPVNTTNQTANTFSSLEMYIPNYAGSNQKSISIDHVQENNAASAYSTLVAGLSTKTAAISSITFYGYGGATVSFAQNTNFYLYGIKNS